MKKRTYLIAAGLAACIAIATGALVHVISHVISRRALLYEIPSGYKGWIFIQFQDPACPALLTKGIFRVVKILPGGRACTSGSGPEGTYFVRFEYVYPNGARRELPWSTSSGGDALVRLLTYDPNDKSEIDFVGNKDEFMHAGSPPYPRHHSNTDGH
jgi:uncharacterized protein DUF6843